MILGYIGKLIRKLLGQDATYMIAWEGKIYFTDRKPWHRMPIYVHQPTKAVWELEKMNWYLHSRAAIYRKAKTIAEGIRSSDNLDKIEGGMFATGLLRIALESTGKDLVELGGKYFERGDVRLVHEGKAFHRSCFECLGNNLISL